MHDLFCVISTRDEVTSATVNDARFFSVGMFCSIELMNSEDVPVIFPPISSVSNISSVSQAAISGKTGPLEQKEEQG